jgi:hypothetical protein
VRESVRARAEQSAPAVDTLSRELVRVSDWNTDTPWVPVVTPRGIKGYVDRRHIQSLLEERICLRKQPDGAWLISGYIGGGD